MDRSGHPVSLLPEFGEQGNDMWRLGKMTLPEAHRRKKSAQAVFRPARGANATNLLPTGTRQPGCPRSMTLKSGESVPTRVVHRRP
jgi:hypothetical protein